MQLSVLIVTYNSREHIGDCLRSIKERTSGVEYEVIVADNDSQDGCADYIEAEFPWVQLIRTGSNLGFGTANNRAAAQARGEVYFCLNDDTVLTQNSLRAVYERVHADESIGVLGHHLIFPDGSHQDSVRRDPHLLDQMIVLTKIHNVLPGLPPIRRYLAANMDYTVEQEVEQLMGACMVIRADVFNAVGGFDEHFFVWFEEVDLIKRIREQLGMRILYTPHIEMIHVKGASFGKQLSVVNQRHMNKSMRYYFRKHHGWLSFVVLAGLHPLSMALSWIVQLLKQRNIQVTSWKRGQN